MRGIYVIISELTKPVEIEVRSGRCFTFNDGCYAYVGSALSGLEARINRHLAKTKKYHWHIDYLLHHALIRSIIYAETEHREECFIARELAKKLFSVPHFGCSDCRCSSHLFFAPSQDKLRQRVIEAFTTRNLIPQDYLFNNKK